MKILRWIFDNILFILTLFLLAFIPLYPKLPLLDIQNTWVYVRAEDFVVAITLIIWAILLLRKKIRLKTPLTLPIMLFWIIGAVATIHAALLIFPSIANVFPNVAFLSMLRRIEYMSLFFVAYCGMKDKRFLQHVVGILSITLFFVVLYGVGQKYLGFPAYLTMNEEFAKGIPIHLSSLSRVPSTFGGQYDLAAYLVLIIPILMSMIFGFRNWFVKLLLLTTVFMGVGLLFMTVSRVSFFVLLISLLLVLFFQKKRFIFVSLPGLIILAFLLVSFSPALLQRFGNTLKEVDLLVHAKTGEPIGQVEEVSSTHFEKKIIIRKVFQNSSQLSSVISEKENPADASPSAIYPFAALSPQVDLVEPANTPTGESLPQGTGYINLPLSPVTKRLGAFFYDKPVNPESTESAKTFIFFGDFLVKRASAYDLSFTTRFQGEWPHAIEAFKRNIFFGSGYSSISLAVDNNYLRILGEVGLLGFASFFAIFIVLGIYIRKLLPQVDSPQVRSFVFGFVAGTIGLSLNALFIDVFEASKIAYVLWLLTGVTLGILHFYQTKDIAFLKELKNVVTARYAIILYLLIISMVLFSPMLSNYFVGDDFTWFRWVADCNSGIGKCVSHYFTEANGFFYRPGTKLYFLAMYSIFWLNQTVYHIASVLLHFIVALLVFLLAKKVLRDFLLSALSAFSFLILSGYSEAVFWISSTGFLLTSVCILLSLLLFILWREKRKLIYFIGSFFALSFGLLFHELGVVTPLFIILYTFVDEELFSLGGIFKNKHYAFLFSPLLPYLAIRFFAQSHWLNGDYSYNLLKLPLNIVGNAAGYFSLILFGPASLPFYQTLRNFSKDHMVVAIPVILGGVYIFVLLYKMVVKKMEKAEKRVVIFGFLFFIISLLPFLGLGNIASRYSYLGAIGIIFLFVIFIKKLYRYLLDSGRDVALAATSLAVALFCLLQIIQVEQIQSNWYEAGEKTKRFLIAIEEVYADYWTKEHMEFHFVHVPIRVGEAWVFPVGLPDALWLVFRNPDIAVYQSQSVDEALGEVDGSPNKKVFEFDINGKVLERKKIVSVR